MKNKSILVTGACGSVGKELIRQLVMSSDKSLKVVGLDNNESDLFFLDQEYLENKNVKFFVADVRDEKLLSEKMRGVDVVFHCAALKHVVLCERSPDQAILTNIQGVQNVVSAATANNVEKVIFTSSDKAVNPTNVMGTSKLMGERLISAASSSANGSSTIFASTRFGNVLGSNGSVIPIFHKQISQGGPVTLTHADMTRFVMTVEAAVSLVIKTANLAMGGEVFITKMPVLRIEDLAAVMIRELAPRYGYDPSTIEIVEIGIKPGEKLYEELMSDEEMRRAVELDQYFSVTPAFSGMYSHADYDYSEIVSHNVTNPYISSDEPYLSQDEIATLLHANDLLEGEGSEFESRYWPGDKSLD